MEDPNGSSVDSTSPELAAVAENADAAFDAAFNSSQAAKPETVTESPSVQPPAETAKPEGSTPSAEAASPVTTQPDESAEWKNLVAKYNGDEKAAAREAAQVYWKHGNEASKWTREKEELAAKLAAYEKQGSTPSPEAPKPAPQELPIELKRYDEKIRAVETNFATTQQDRAKYAQYGVQLDQEIRTLNRQIANPNLLVDKDELVTRLSEKINEREATTNWIAKLDTDLRSFDDKWQELKENRDIRSAILEQRKELEAAREAKARSIEEAESQEGEKYISTYRENWFGTIDRISKDANVVPDILAEEFREYVEAKGLARVSAGSPIPDKEVESFVRETAGKFLAQAKKFHEHQARLYGQQKKADEKLTSPSGAAAMASETKRPRSDWTQKQWDEYEENIRL